MTRKPPYIDDPHKATATPYNCLDTGGWYLGSERPKTLKEIDRDSFNIATTPQEQNIEALTSQEVTKAINGGELDKDRRLKETRAAKEILL